MRDIRFTPDGFSEYHEWSQENKGIYNKLHKLINEAARTPFEGTGKPEPLKHELKGYWSRRITDEHRLVYAVENDSIVIVACKNHYGQFFAPGVPYNILLKTPLLVPVPPLRIGVKLKSCQQV